MEMCRLLIMCSNNKGVFSHNTQSKKVFHQEGYFFVRNLAWYFVRNVNDVNIIYLTSYKKLSHLVINFYDHFYDFDYKFFSIIRYVDDKKVNYLQNTLIETERNDSLTFIIIKSFWVVIIKATALFQTEHQTVIVSLKARYTATLTFPMSFQMALFN